uniref:Protein kinase domain-containing protein n=1 Tax=Panagrolaimus sp. PS1159 TaxID=55785 RepID=A0AC35GA05_9BILA
MPPKKGKTAAGHVKCDKIPEGTIFKGSHRREFVVGKEFAQGGFGRICDAKLVGKSEKLIIKLEPSGNGPLFTEMHVFQRILRPEMLEAFKRKQKLTHLGLPYLVDSGMQDDIRFLIMPKYSYCLDHILKESRSPLKLDNVVEVLICVCNALKYIHENDYVHADIKAANIMMNKKNGFNETYLIDFGLARKVGTVVEKEDKKKAHDGTALFTSIDAHRGCGFTFRGDVEILGHNAIFWLTKTLPWKDIFNEDATIKMKNEQLVEVRAAKEDLLSNLSTNIKKYVSDLSAASVVQLLYKASQIEINIKPDFDGVIKSLSNVYKGKKKVAESDSDDAPQSSTARRGRKPAVAAEEVPPSSSRSIRKKKSESDIEELDPPVSRKAKIAAKKEEAPTPIATNSRRGKQNAAELPPSCSAKSRARQTSENEIIPGLSTKRAGRAAMPSYQEESEEESDEEEYVPLPPQKSNRRTAPTPKIPARSKTEATPITSTRSRIQSHEVLPISTPSSRKYPYVNSSLPSPIKKPSHTHEFKPLTDNQTTKIPTPQLPALESRTRSVDQKLFSPRIPSASNYEQYYKGTEPKPKTPLAKCRSRSVENSPPNSPEFRIQAIPPPQGCNII